MRESNIFMKSVGSFCDYPSYDFLIKPYKIKAKDWDGIRHTEKQISYASYLGFRDWQAFTYRLKTLQSTMATLNLSDIEWQCIFEATRDYVVASSTGKSHLLNRLCDSDFFDSPEEKARRYEMQSSGTGPHLILNHQRKELLKKVNEMSEEMCSAIWLKSLVFWDRTYSRSFKFSPKSSINREFEGNNLTHMFKILDL